LRRTDDPVVQAEARISEARRDFASDVDALLTELRQHSAAMGENAVDAIGRLAAWRVLRQHVLEKFDTRLNMTPAADPILRQLVEEAYDLLTNPETRLDLREWTKTAKPWVRR
jgi:hypothetical protein